MLRGTARHVFLRRHQASAKESRAPIPLRRMHIELLVTDTAASGKPLMMTCATSGQQFAFKRKQKAGRSQPCKHAYIHTTCVRIRTGTAVDTKGKHNRGVHGPHVIVKIVHNDFLVANIDIRQVCRCLCAPLRYRCRSTASKRSWALHILYLWAPRAGMCAGCTVSPFFSSEQCKGAELTHQTLAAITESVCQPCFYLNSTAAVLAPKAPNRA